MKRITFVVVNENIFGCIDPRQPLQVQVLSSSVIRGASHGWADGPYPIRPNFPNVRPATRRDFVSFSVSIKGFDTDPNYKEILP